MKKFRRVLAFALASALIFAMSGMSVLAADSFNREQYTYTVTLSGGNIAPELNETKSEIAYGDSYSANVAAGTEFGDYYVRGVAYAGTTDLIPGSFTVTEDTDLVVVWGVKSDNMATYTVRYINAETGEELLDSKTYTGKDGDKPIVSYEYIEDFTPRDAYNLTGTITSGTVFTFYYVPREVETTVVTGETTINYRNVQGETTEDDTDNGNNAGGGDNAQGGDNQTIDDTQTPRDLIDVDEEDIPTDNTKLDSDSDSDSASAAVATSKLPYIGGGVAVAAILLLILALSKKKRNGNA